MQAIPGQASADRLDLETTTCGDLYPVFITSKLAASPLAGVVICPYFAVQRAVGALI